MAPPIFLDFDGVIVDSLGIYIDLYKDLCQRHSKTLPVSDLLGFRAWYEANWEKNFFEMGFSKEEYLQICTDLPDTLDYSATALFQGIPQMLTELAKTEHPMVIVSTAPTRSIKERLEKAKLLDLFEDVTGSDDGSTHKAQRLASLLKRFDARTGIMVGDTNHDIEAGQANNLVTIGVTYGWITPQRVEAANPNFLVEFPEDLHDAINKALEICVSQP
jgi:phosphoglycolate phosphatase